MVNLMGIGSGARSTTLWVTPLSPGEHRTASQSGFRASVLALSPTGDRIAYAEEAANANSTSNSSVSIVARGGGRPRLLADRLPAIQSLKWSPDGRFLAAQARSPEGSGVQGLVVVSVEDGKSRPLPLPTPAAQEAFSSKAFVGVKDFAWSPDSARLALLYDGAGPCWTGGRDLGPSGCYASIYTMRADGSGLVRLSQRYQSGGSIFWVR